MVLVLLCTLYPGPGPRHDITTQCSNVRVLTSFMSKFDKSPNRDFFGATCVSFSIGGLFVKRISTKVIFLKVIL